MFALMTRLVLGDKILAWLLMMLPGSQLDGFTPPRYLWTKDQKGSLFQAALEDGVWVLECKGLGDIGVNKSDLGV